MKTRVDQLIKKGDNQAALNLLRNVAEEAKNGQKEIAAEALAAVAKNSRRVQSNGNGKTMLANIRLYVEALELVDSRYPEAAKWTDALVNEALSFESMYKQKLDGIYGADSLFDKVEKSISFAELMSGYSTQATIAACKMAETYLLDWYVLERLNIRESKVLEFTKNINMRELKAANEKQSEQIKQVKNMLNAKHVDLNMKILELIMHAESGKPEAEVAARKIVYIGNGSTPKEDGNRNFVINPYDLHNIDLSIKIKDEMMRIEDNMQKR